MRQPEHRRIGGVAAVPIRAALDLDGAVHQRRAGRRQHDIGGDVPIAEDLQLAVANPCRRDQKPWAVRPPQRGEIDLLRQHLTERIKIERIELAGP